MAGFNLLLAVCLCQIFLFSCISAQEKIEDVPSTAVLVANTSLPKNLSQAEEIAVKFLQELERNGTNITAYVHNLTQGIITEEKYKTYLQTHNVYHIFYNDDDNSSEENFKIKFKTKKAKKHKTNLLLLAALPYVHKKYKEGKADKNKGVVYNGFGGGGVPITGFGHGHGHGQGQVQGHGFGTPPVFNNPAYGNGLPNNINPKNNIGWNVPPSGPVLHPGGQIPPSAPVLHPGFAPPSPVHHPGFAPSAPVLHPGVAPSAPVLHPGVAPSAPVLHPGSHAAPSAPVLHPGSHIAPSAPGLPPGWAVPTASRPTISKPTSSGGSKSSGWFSPSRSSSGSGSRTSSSSRGSSSSSRGSSRKG